MKRKLLVLAAIVLAALLIWALLPKTSMINVQTTAYEYALNQTEPIAEHEISIGGRYTKRLFREDVFSGHMLISGFQETNGASVYIQFWDEHDYGVISYQQGGVPVWETELKQIYANDDFSELVIQLFAFKKEGDEIHSSWSADTGRVLTTAQDYDTMTALCSELGLAVILEEG